MAKITIVTYIGFLTFTVYYFDHPHMKLCMIRAVDFLKPNILIIRWLNYKSLNTGPNNSIVGLNS